MRASFDAFLLVKRLKIDFYFNCARVPAKIIYFRRFKRLNVWVFTVHQSIRSRFTKRSCVYLLRWWKPPPCEWILTWQRIFVEKETKTNVKFLEENIPKHDFVLTLTKQWSQLGFSVPIARLPKWLIRQKRQKKTEKIRIRKYKVTLEGDLCTESTNICRIDWRICRPTKYQSFVCFVHSEYFDEQKN